MEVTSKEKDNLRTIICKLLQNDKAWMEEKNIRVGDKDDYWILNYGVEHKNEFNRLVRGLVVKKPNKDWIGDNLDLIKSFPFIRFFNQGETQADQIDIDNAEMLEKMDGNMVGVFFPTKNPESPHWHTRRMLNTYEVDMNLTLVGFNGKNYKLMQIIGDYIKDLTFSQEDVNHTYVFEFIHIASTVLTKYKSDQYGLYLLAARNLETYSEECEEKLDSISSRISAKRPRRWDAIADKDEVAKMMKEISLEVENFEGMVFRDKITGKRVKVKEADYLEKHYLLSRLSVRRLVPIIFNGEEDEIISYFPKTKSLIEKIKTKHAAFKEKTIRTIKSFDEHKNIPKNELWKLVNKSIEDQFTQCLVMRHVKKPLEDLDFILEKELRNLAVKPYEKDTYVGVKHLNGVDKRYLSILDIKDEEIYNDVGEI